MYVIKHKNEDWWIADWQGDPGRTLKIGSAKKYNSKKGANVAMSYYKKRYGHIRNMDLIINNFSYQPMPYE
jgi:hypothetical protein